MLKDKLPKKVYSTGKEVINWKEITEGFEIEVDGKTLIVVKNENVEKVSKSTGKAYKTRRLLITDIDRLVELEVGSESFKKGSFIKRFDKLLKQVKPKRVIIDLTEEKTEVTEEDKAFLESHTMTDSEMTDQRNRLYRILTERGLLQAYSDWEHGKTVDKDTVQQIMIAIDDSMEEDLDFDEIERMLAS